MLKKSDWQLAGGDHEEEHGTGQQDIDNWKDHGMSGLGWE